jgi:hypothetical protein
MRTSLCQILTLVAMLTSTSIAIASTDKFSFGVIPREIRATVDDSTLRDAIIESDADNLAFVVANGIKAANEPCTDAAYSRRKGLLHTAKHGLIVSLAGSDWADCKSETGRSIATARLSRLRELFFVDEFSIGATRLPLIRQSATVKFHSFVENARWGVGNVMFATINLPGGNNHYVSAAGRNSEFEDRLVANRDWLNRIFLHATHDEMAAVVLFSDGNPLTRGRSGKRDGYIETRREILAIAAKFPGKVLIVHGQPSKRSRTHDIRWRKNIGEVGVAGRRLKIAVRPHEPALFFVESGVAPGN